VIAHNNQFVKKETKQKYSKNWPYDVKDGLIESSMGIPMLYPQRMHE